MVFRGFEIHTHLSGVGSLVLRIAVSDYAVEVYLRQRNVSFGGGGERGTSVTQIFASKQCQLRRGICSGGKTPLVYSFSFFVRAWAYAHWAQNLLRNGEMAGLFEYNGVGCSKPMSRVRLAFARTRDRSIRYLLVVVF